MREYKCTDLSGQTVDLDDPNTYKHLPIDVDVLDKLMFEHIGKALVYMDYFPDRKGMYPKRKKSEDELLFNCGYHQRLRIQKLIQNFANERANNYNNVMWYQEQLFLFIDETENMC